MGRGGHSASLEDSPPPTNLMCPLTKAPLALISCERLSLLQYLLLDGLTIGWWTDMIQSMSKKSILLCPVLICTHFQLNTLGKSPSPPKPILTVPASSPNTRGFKGMPITQPPGGAASLKTNARQHYGHIREVLTRLQETLGFQ